MSSSPDSTTPPKQTTRQIKVAPSLGEQRIIAELSRYWKRSEGDVVLDGFRRSLTQLLEEHERLKAIDAANSYLQESSPMKLLLIRLAAGEAVKDSEIKEVAIESGVDATTLIAIKKYLAKK